MGHLSWRKDPVARAVAASALASWFLASGCSPFAGVGSNDEPLRSDGGPGAPAGECVLQHPPERPQHEIEDSAGEPALTFVTYRLDYGDWPGENGRHSYEMNGFDLDGMCTGEESGPACSVADWAEPSVYAVDGEGGIDNAIGAAFSLVTRGTLSASNLATDLATSGKAPRLQSRRGKAPTSGSVSSTSSTPIGHSSSTVRTTCRRSSTSTKPRS
jgi:hypothetical protein